MMHTRLATSNSFRPNSGFLQKFGLVWNVRFQSRGPTKLNLAVGKLVVRIGVQSRFFTCIAAMKFWVDWVDWKTTTCKKLPRYYQPFWFTWIVVSLICVVYITLARRLCWEYSHWWIIFNQPIKIFLAKTKTQPGRCVYWSLFSMTGEKIRFLDWKCR